MMESVESRTEDLVRSVRFIRPSLIAGFGVKMVKAPHYWLKAGIEDFRRYRRPRAV